MVFVGHDLRGHTNEAHASELRRRQEQSTATGRALLDSTNVVQGTASQAKQQAATGQCSALDQTCCVLDLILEPISPLSIHMVQVHIRAWLVSSDKHPSCVA